MTPEEMLARLLYRDALMLVIDKPAGFAVHKGPKGGISLEDFFDALRFGLPRRPALAHRLDRDTSGCLVLGRHRKALATLGKLFKRGDIGKTYWAVVEGGPTDDEGRIDLALGRLDDTRGWWMKPDTEGQPAATTWRVLGRAEFSFTSPLEGEHRRSSTAVLSSKNADAVHRLRREAVGRGVKQQTQNLLAYPPPQPSPSGGEGEERVTRARGSHFTWLALEPLTGRTHQLRVHCAAMGWPVVGDNIYGTQASLRRLRKESPPRTGGPILHLHSREVVVPLYKNRDPIRVSAPVPEHMRERLKACGWDEVEPAKAATLAAQANQ